MPYFMEDGDKHIQQTKMEYTLIDSYNISIRIVIAKSNAFSIAFIFVEDQFT